MHLQTLCKLVLHLPLSSLLHQIWHHRRRARGLRLPHPAKVFQDTLPFSLLAFHFVSSLPSTLHKSSQFLTSSFSEGHLNQVGTIWSKHHIWHILLTSDICRTAHLNSWDSCICAWIIRNQSSLPQQEWWKKTGLMLYMVTHDLWDYHVLSHQLYKAYRRKLHQAWQETTQLPPLVAKMKSLSHLPSKGGFDFQDRISEA